MQLKSIKSDKCPICGCTKIVKECVDFDEREILTHCNGTQWEHRFFLCGLEVYFSPNFYKEYTNGNCKNDPKYLAYLEKVETDKEKLIAFCEENNIEEYMLNRIKRYV